MTRHLLRPAAIHAATRTPSFHGPALRLAALAAADQAAESLAAIGFRPRQQRLAAGGGRRRRLDLADRLSLRPSLLGRGVLLSRRQDRRVLITLVSEAEAAGLPFQSVLASVLNGSELIEDVSGPWEGEEWLFLKEDHQYANDVEELQRLSGSYNVTRASLRGGGEEVSLEHFCANELNTNEAYFYFIFIGKHFLSMFFCNGGLFSSSTLRRIFYSGLSSTVTV